MTTTPLLTTIAPVFIGTLDQCLNVTVLVQKSFWDVDHVWVAMAALFGLILGVGIAFACSVVCIKSYNKKKRQDAEEAWMRANNIPAHKQIVGDDEYDYEEIEETIITEDQYNLKDEDGGGQKKGRKKGGKKGKKQDDDDYDNSDLKGIDLGQLDRGILDALILPTGAGMTYELTSQDLLEILRLEGELWDEKINTFIFLLKKVLEKYVDKELITEEFAKYTVEKFERALRSIKTNCDNEHKEAEEVLRKRDDLKKNPQLLEKELDDLQSKTNQKRYALFIKIKEDVHKELKKSDLSEDELEAIMSKLTKDMANYEKKLDIERQRQAMSLEERLARRRQLADKLAAQKEEGEKDIQIKTEIHNDSLEQFVQDGKLLERQKDEILQEYEKNLQRVHDVHQEELQRQQLALADKLKRAREQKLKKLEAKHIQERENFVKQVDKMTTTTEISETYSNMMLQQRSERDELINDLDTEEVNQLNRLRQETEVSKDKDMQKQDDDLRENLETKAQLSQKDVDRLMKLHQQQVDEYDRIKNDERKKMNAKLKERLAERKQKIEEDNLKAQAEQQALEEKQENTLKIVLEQQLELTEEAKKRIMIEHEENTAALNNQLNMSRLRQKKQLEAKLNARKSKVAELKQKQEDAKRSKQETNQKEREKLEKELEQQIKAEEEQVASERETAIAEFRQRLALETENALTEQNAKLGQLIGRLQVGQARRQAIIAKQNKTLEELQEQLANKVTEHGDTPTGTDQILQQHHNQVENLTGKLQENKERQERILRERLEAKKLKKEREISQKIDEEAQQEWEAQRQRGAGNASVIMTQMLMEQKHKKAMQEMELDFQKELHRQKEEINRELEEEMRQEMDEHQKQFLANLAAISNLSKDDLNEIVENAVADGGGSDKQAKKLLKEMRTEVKRAKSSYGTRGADEDRDEDTKRMKRSRTNYDDDDDMYEEGLRKPHPKSGKKRPKSAFKD